MIPGLPIPLKKRIENPVTIVGRASYSGTSEIVSHNVTLPASVAGDLLLLAMVSAGTSSGAAIETPAGWTVVHNTTGSNRLYIFAKTAAGTEGTSVSVTLGAARRTAAVSYCIRGVTEGYSGAFHPTSGNPPAVTAPWGRRNNLFICILATSGSNPVPTGGAPEGYVDFLLAHTGPGSSNNPLIATAYAFKYRASDDPGYFDGFLIGRVATLVVR